MDTFTEHTSPDFGTDTATDTATDIADCDEFEEDDLGILVDLGPAPRPRVTRERRLTLLATAAAALHVIDDNVINPDWGGIQHHVASTLVPLTALAALVRYLPRRRSGTKATMTSTLGILALMLGSEAIYDLTSNTMSGDDYTGLLSFAAGLGLLGIGVRQLWCSRRRTGSRWRRTWRRALRTIVALLVMAHVTYPLAETYAVTNASVQTVSESRLGVPYEDVSFRTSDGLDLRGWFVPSTNGATIIVFPGRTHAQDHAQMLIEHGYGVLLFDKRGTGESDGEPNGYGWNGQRDIHGAVAYLQGRDDVDPDRIGGIGLSVGGELMLQAAAEWIGLRAVVSEGAGVRSIRELRGIGWVPSVSAVPIYATVTVAAAVFSNSLPPTALHDLVPEIDVPTFFIYAKNGHGGEMLSEDYYEAATGPKELWEIDGPHIRGIEAAADEYERRVIAFYDVALLG